MLGTTTTSTPEQASQSPYVVTSDARSMAFEPKTHLLLHNFSLMRTSGLPQVVKIPHPSSSMTAVLITIAVLSSLPLKLVYASSSKSTPSGCHWANLPCHLCMHHYQVKRNSYMKTCSKLSPHHHLLVFNPDPTTIIRYLELATIQVIQASVKM